MDFLLTAALSFLIIGIAIAAMAVGVAAGRRPIKGSCGGLNAGGCTLCGSECKRARASGPGDR